MRGTFLDHLSENAKRPPGKHPGGLNLISRRTRKQDALGPPADQANSGIGGDVVSHVRKSGRKAKPWRADVTDAKAPSGKVSRSFERKSEAKNWVTGQESDKLAGTYVTPADGQITVRARWDAWVKAAVHQRETTKDREGGSARSLVLPTFGEVPLADVDFEMVEAWVAELVEAGYAASTIHKAHQVLSKVLAHSVKAGKLRANPAAGVHLPTIKLQVQRILDADEIPMVMDCLPEQYRLWFLLSVMGGTRAEEAFALRAGRVDRVNPEIDITETVVETTKGLVWGEPKTKDGKRRVDLPDELWEMLREEAKGKAGNELLFTAAGGGAVRLHNFRSRVWQRAVIEAGLGRIVGCERIVTGSVDCSLCKPGSTRGAKGGHYVGPNIHDLRHTAVSLWIAQGSNPLQVKERAGHSKITFTYDRYGHLFPKERDPAMAGLDKMLRGFVGKPKVTALHAVG